jgi:hypothetical protein
LFSLIYEKYIYQNIVVKICPCGKYVLYKKRKNDEKIPPAALDRE